MIARILLTSPTATTCRLSGLMYFRATRSMSSALTAVTFAG